MANSGLAKAKNAKNDEFYTQYYDIEKEMNAYLEYNPDVFKNKTILLPCDDPEWSNFTKFFAQNFERFGLKKLISTSFAPESKKYKTGYQPSLFEQNDIKFDKDKTKTNGKIFVLDHDVSGDGKIDVEDLQWDYLQGDGDFRSTEIKNLRDEVTCAELEEKQHFTQPPAHYTEASLVKTLEELGIGRPSTYAPTISLILGRRYVTKEGKNLYMTEIGEVVNNMMKQSFPSIVDVHFTANMEGLLETNLRKMQSH